MTSYKKLKDECIKTLESGAQHLKTAAKVGKFALLAATTTASLTAGNVDIAQASEMGAYITSPTSIVMESDGAQNIMPASLDTSNTTSTAIDTSNMTAGEKLSTIVDKTLDYMGTKEGKHFSDEMHQALIIMETATRAPVSVQEEIVNTIDVDAAISDPLYLSVNEPAMENVSILLEKEKLLPEGTYQTWDEIHYPMTSLIEGLGNDINRSTMSRAQFNAVDKALAYSYYQDDIAVASELANSLKDMGIVDKYENGERIKSTRTSLDLTQEEVDKLNGLSNQFVEQQKERHAMVEDMVDIKVNQRGNKYSVAAGNALVDVLETRIPGNDHFEPYNGGPFMITEDRRVMTPYISDEKGDEMQGVKQDLQDARDAKRTNSAITSALISGGRG